MTKHTKEPWGPNVLFPGLLYGEDPGGGPNAKRVVACFDLGRLEIGGVYDPEREAADLLRTAQCVNAFRGIEDPKAFVQAVSELTRLSFSLYDGIKAMEERTGRDQLGKTAQDFFTAAQVLRRVLSKETP